MRYALFRVIGSIAMLLTVSAVSFRPALFVAVLVLAIPAMAQHVFLPGHRLDQLAFVTRLLSTVFDLLIVAIISTHILRIKRPTADTIFGALCIYLLVGFAFAGAYQAIGNAVPGAFYLDPMINMHTAPDRFDFIYFSFGTLTALGTTGIAAKAPVVRSLSVVEVIVGLVYFAVLISRLISAYRAVSEHA